MNIFQILGNLYTNPSSKWILDLNDNDINPIVIQRFLSLNRVASQQTRILNKFVYTVSPKMYLSAAWSVLFFNGQKLNKTPFVRYIKKNEEELKYPYVFEKIQRQYKISDKDLMVVYNFVLDDIEKDKYKWFSYYGVASDKWLINNMDINLLKQYNIRKNVNKKTLLEGYF